MIQFKSYKDVVAMETSTAMTSDPSHSYNQSHALTFML